MRRRDSLWWSYTTIITTIIITTTPVLTSNPSRLRKGGCSAQSQPAPAVGCVFRLERILPSLSVADGGAQKIVGKVQESAGKVERAFGE
jgi:hypothetical protein